MASHTSRKEDERACIAVHFYPPPLSSGSPLPLWVKPLASGSSLSKRAVRVIGVAESGIAGSVHSYLASVVMRIDLVIDGMLWDKITIQGTDATDITIKMVRNLSRTDCNAIMLRGTIIAGYNIIDLARLHEATSLPVISVTSEPQENLRDHLIHTFPKDWESRWKITSQNGDAKSLSLETRTNVFVQWKGIEWSEVKGVVRRLTRFGGIPEPLRVARLLARALTKNCYSN